MGTDIECMAIASEGMTEAETRMHLRELAKVIETYESRLSRFRTDSELSFVNLHVGEWVTISGTLAELLRLSIQAHRRTDGLFNPCVGQWMEHYGYRVTFDHIDEDQGIDTPKTPKAPAMVPLLHRDSLPFALSSDATRVYLEPGYKLDLGGIAKGWIVERAASHLSNQGLTDFVISAGGDMVCEGKRGEVAWSIGIEDPKRPSQPVMTLDVTSCCVATSGTYRRHWLQDGQARHHLVDPRTSAPATSDVVSCTVLAQSLVAAEVYAKAALLMGRAAAPSWLAQRQTLGWVIIMENGDVDHSWNS